MHSPRQVIFTCDHRFVKPLMVVVYSLLKHARTDCALTVYVAHDARFVDEGCDLRIRRVASAFPFAKLVFLNADELLAKHADVLQTERNGLSPIIWAGPLLTELLPSEVVGNIVYLDVDMLVTADLAPLYGLDLAGRGMLAAAIIEGPRARFGYLESCGWAPGARHYFNNGTTVVNLDDYRRENVAARILRWYAAHRESALATDQDSQNAVFGDRILPLPPKWNYNDGWVARLPKSSPFAADIRGLPAEQILEAVIRPCIIHYINNKPWTFCHRPERKRYHACMRELGIFDRRLDGQTAGERLELAFYDLYNGLVKLYARLLFHFRKSS